MTRAFALIFALGMATQANLPAHAHDPSRPQPPTVPPPSASSSVASQPGSVGSLPVSARGAEPTNPVQGPAPDPFQIPNRIGVGVTTEVFQAHSRTVLIQLDAAREELRLIETHIGLTYHPLDNQVSGPILHSSNRMTQQETNGHYKTARELRVDIARNEQLAKDASQQYQSAKSAYENPASPEEMMKSEAEKNRALARLLDHQNQAEKLKNIQNAINLRTRSDLETQAAGIQKRINELEKRSGAAVSSRGAPLE